jgi:hypothetical protein
VGVVRPEAGQYALMTTAMRLSTRPKDCDVTLVGKLIEQVSTCMLAATLPRFGVSAPAINPSTRSSVL